MYARLQAISKNPFYSALGYLLVILGILLWSGRVTEVITLDGIEFQSNDYENNRRFYSDVLRLAILQHPEADSEVKSGQSLNEFRLSDQRRLVLRPRDANDSGEVKMLFRVRSGAERLRTKFVSRGAYRADDGITRDDFLKSASKGTVSPLYKTDTHKEFLVRDFSNNVLIFADPPEPR